VDVDVDAGFLMQMVLEARANDEKVEKTIAQLRETHRAIKEANDVRIEKIQEENRQLDNELASKEANQRQLQKENEAEIQEARAKLLRRIHLCNLKNLHLQKGQSYMSLPEDKLSVVHAGLFCTVFDRITISSKPVNCYEWKIEVVLPETKEHVLNSLLEKTWKFYRELARGFGADSILSFVQRDFKSEEDAKGFAERNKERICGSLIESIKQLEAEIDQATESMDEVFDFRLIFGSDLHSPYSRRNDEQFQIVSAEKHQLVLSPFLSNYDRRVEKILPYTVTVTQQGYDLSIANHRFSGQARSIKYAINEFFTTEFQATEADTQQKVPNPSY
jgi:hypothetical protein